MNSNCLLLNTFGFFPNFLPFSTSFIASMLRTERNNVHHMDVNLMVWETILSKEFIKNCKWIQSIGKETPVPFPINISEKKFDVLKENVLQNIVNAKKIFKDKILFYNMEKLTWAINIVFQSQQVIFCHYGLLITNKVIFWPEMGFNVNNMKNIYKYAIDKQHNPFIIIFEEKILPKIKEINPSIIGVDIIFPWEILPALTLNLILKEELPNIHINFMGHGFDEMNFARVAHRLRKNEKLFFAFDSIFLARNDDALLKMYCSIDDKSYDLTRTESLAINSKNNVYINGPLEEGKIRKDIIPTYDGLELEKYYTPKIVLIEKISSKCFWNKCAFCNINLFKKYRQEISPDDFIKKLKSYKDSLGAIHFFILDEAVDPVFAKDFTDKLTQNNDNFIWSIRTRVDSGFNYNLLKKMHKAGCRELWLGMETISPRLLKEMNKTTKPEKYVLLVKRIMKDCNEIGIGLHFCFILGFPTERPEDREMLLQYFRDNIKYVKNMPFFATFNVFNLNYGTDVFNNPPKYGIKKVNYNDECFNMINIDYKTYNGNDITNCVYENELENCAEKLTDLLVKNEMLKLLWFTVGDSPWELLLKEHFYKKGNPFQEKTPLAEKLLLKLYFKIENKPFLFNIFNKLSNKKVMTSKSQLYR